MICCQFPECNCPAFQAGVLCKTTQELIRPSPGDYLVSDEGSERLDELPEAVPTGYRIVHYDG